MNRVRKIRNFASGFNIYGLHQLLNISCRHTSTEFRRCPRLMVLRHLRYADFEFRIRNADRDGCALLAGDTRAGLSRGAARRSRLCHKVLHFRRQLGSCRKQHPGEQFSATEIDIHVLNRMHAGLPRTHSVTASTKSSANTLVTFTNYFFRYPLKSNLSWKIHVIRSF